MKRLFKWMMPRLLAGFFMGAASITALGVPGAPLELNGISSFFGDKSAFFIFPQPNALAPHSFMLAEGESRFGVRLISVDTVSNVVQVENGGQMQFLRLGTAPNLTSSSVAGVAENQELLARDGNDSGGNSGGDTRFNGLIDISKMNNTALNNLGIKGHDTSSKQDSPADGNGSNAKQNSPSDGNDSNARQNSPAILNGADPATTLKSQSSADWYQDSARMEKNRLETAPSVLAGNMEPWPLTPLTPSGTPANLIGNDAIYSDHIPGFYQN